MIKDFRPLDSKVKSSAGGSKQFGYWGEDGWFGFGSLGL